jgi:hypothetical protein
VNSGGSDLDLRLEDMGADATITVGAATGPFTMYVLGIGHEGSTKSHIVQAITVTIGAANSPPTLTVNQPDGVGDTVTQGAAFNINYDLADTDDTVTAAFYYDTDNVGLDGTAITGACATAPEGTGATCSWDTTGVTPGTYYVYGITDDGVNPAVNDYSPGQITIDPPPNGSPTLTVNQPDGVSDNVTQGNSYNIDYDLADAEEVVTAAFYYDTDNVGLDGTAISGACATAPEGTGLTCAWDTTGVTLGSYYIYGITDDGVNPQVSAYSSGQVTVNAPNAPPTLSISQPDGVSDTVDAGTPYDITYTLDDTDNVVTAAFYYDTDNAGFDGTAISGACAAAAEGAGVTCSWDTTSVGAGSYYVYGIADDGVNSPVQVYSSGQITINSANQAPNSISAATFSQEEEISTNVITLGRYANENSIVFRATVSDPDTDQVQLEIEIVNVDASFTNTPTGGCTPGALVNSGNQASNTCNVGNGAYKWQGRAKDDGGLPGPWTEY